MKYLLVACVVAEVIGNIKERTAIKNNQIKDLTNFRVYYDTIGAHILDFAAVFFFVLSFLAAGTTDETQKYYWITFALWGLLCLIAALAIRKVIIVKDKEITIKRYLLPSKKFSIYDVTNIETNGETTKFYKNDKLLFTCDKDFVGSKQLLEVFATNKEINHSSLYIKTLTKGWFLNNPPLLVLTIMTFVLTICLAIPSIIEDFSISTLLESIFFCILMVVIAFGPIYLIYTPRTYFLIDSMEKALSINFNDEMKKHGIIDLTSTKDWYISTPAMYKTIVSRDYIKTIIKSKISPFDENVLFVTFKTIDGKEKKIPISSDEETKFNHWYQGKLKFKEDNNYGRK